MAMQVDTARPPSHDRLDEVVALVLQSRRRMIDAWEATSALESLGYTDARVQREFGMSDARAAGEYVYAQARRQPFSDKERWAPLNLVPPGALIARSAASTFVYAVPWLLAFLGQAVSPNVMRLPSRIAPPLALALMFSLVASGGMVQAIARRAEFYVGLKQIAMARHVVHALLRIGIALVLGVAFLVLVVGWYFRLFSWGPLVLGVDAFVAMSLLWMVCGTFAVRLQQWRVAVAFIAGLVAFAIVRAAGADAVTAQFVAVVTVLIIAAVQMPMVFAEHHTWLPRLPRGVTMPRMSVMVYWTVPYFWYGTVYFAFLFADRLAAATAGLGNGGAFGVPAQYGLGMELALLTLLVAASGAEVAGALFARAFTQEAVHPIAGQVAALSMRLRRHHARAVALAVAVFVVTAVAIAAGAHRVLPGALDAQVWRTLIVGDLGYVCLAVGLTNVLALFGTQRPWVVVREFTAALGLNIVTGYVLSHVFGRFHAVDGLLLGAACFAVRTFLAVRRTLAHVDHAYAVG